MQEEEESQRKKKKWTMRKKEEDRKRREEQRRKEETGRKTHALLELMRLLLVNLGGAHERERHLRPPERGVHRPPAARRSATRRSAEGQNVLSQVGHSCHPPWEGGLSAAVQGGGCRRRPAAAACATRQRDKGQAGLAVLCALAPLRARKEGWRHCFCSKEGVWGQEGTWDQGQGTSSPEGPWPEASKKN